MKTTIKELSRRIAAKAGVEFEANTAAELAEFVKELLPNIHSDFTHDTVCFDDFWKWYEGDCIIPAFSMTLAKKDAISLVREVGQRVGGKTDFVQVLDEDDLGDEEYCRPEDVPGDMVYLSCYGYEENLNTILYLFCAASRKFGMSFDVTFYNTHPYGEGEMTWHIERGTMSGRQTYRLTDSGDNEELLITLCRLDEVFGEMSDAMLADIGVELELETGADACKTYPLTECGTCERFRLYYDAFYHGADTAEQRAELVKKYPILYPLFANGDGSRDLLVTFLRANLPYLKRKDMLEEKMDDPIHLRSVSGIHAEEPEVFRNGYTYDPEAEWYAPHLGNEEVLHLLAESDLGNRIVYTPDTYREDLLLREMQAGHEELILSAFAFLSQEIGKHKNTVEALRARYLLREDTPQRMLAFYQCYDLVKQVQKKGEAELCLLSLLLREADLNDLIWDDGENWKPILKLLYSRLDRDEQDWLCDKYYLFYRFRKPEDFTEEQIQDILKNCLCAPLLLPEEAMAKHLVRTADIVYRGVCKLCGKCKMNDRLLSLKRAL